LKFKKKSESRIVSDQVLNPVQEVLKGDEGALGLEVGVLGQVTACPGLLGPEGLLNAIDISQRRNHRFKVELGGLGQIGGLAVVVKGEERGPTLDLGLHKTGRSHFTVTAVVEVITESLKSGGAELQNV